ncbi:MAG: hypothetical protein WBP55_02720 [Solirubrobacterales bacterium]
MHPIQRRFVVEGDNARSDSPARIIELTGVYDANGSVSGELTYWFGARLGIRHCALCDITHGLVRSKKEWRTELGRVPVPFSAVHLDERKPDVAAASDGNEPCVVATRDDGTVEMVIGRSDLDACQGNPARLADLLIKAC